MKRSMKLCILTSIILFISGSISTIEMQNVLADSIEYSHITSHGSLNDSFPSYQSDQICTVHDYLVHYSAPRIVDGISSNPPDFENGTIWYVDDEPGEGPENPAEDFTSIQDAINASSDGDTVYVYDGWYQENLEVDRSIKLHGHDVNTTVIDGNDDGVVVQNAADWITITGFTIQHGFQGIMLLKIDNNFIEKNAIIHNQNAGIRGLFSTEITIRQNEVIDNQKKGIDIHYSSDISISNNTINNNNQTGIWVFHSTNLTIDRNRCVMQNGSGIVLSGSSHNQIKGNEIGDNLETGIDLIDSFFNVVEKNQVMNNRDIGIWLLLPGTKNNTIMENMVSGNNHGILLTLFPSHNEITMNQCVHNHVDGIGVSYQSDNNMILYNNCSDNMKGIAIRESMNSMISNNICKKNQHGILLNTVNNTMVEMNVLNRNGVGIYLFNANRNMLFNNSCSYNGHKGITLRQGSNHNTLERNRIGPWNYQGIYFEKSGYNTIRFNDILENNDDGIGLVLTFKNTFHHNNIVGNTNFGIEGLLCLDNAQSNYWGPYTTPLLHGDILAAGIVLVWPSLSDPVDLN